MAMPWELAEYLMAVTWVSLARWVAACVSLADGIACSLRRRRRHWQASSTVVVS
ncbi:Os12g0267000 [Oryza sativa Japonica Group]|uniref:Os12g0267000 protein n=1 Tax=Oryza sativa subsp. japonica TaxID=39947 RepID=C7J9G6_ORYSJ|nr:Os12g0267000 [Oryza sativa Japonica Group]|eukprot:NP_001176888.1 Os12g0267000 [Oryza sativa Japonica Group]